MADDYPGTSLVPIHEVQPRVELGVIRADSPKELVRVATEAADALAGLIKAKKLFSNIQGKEYVKVEGWTTLATMMGCLPREVSVTRDDKGTYTATVELVRMSDGAVLTRASAECGMDEKTWAGRADYARRSMAATRATSKACRLAFSWVMVLAGYDATPSEEIPESERGGKSTVAKGPRAAAAPAPVQAAPTLPQEPLTDKPRVLNHNPDPLKGQDVDAPTWPFGTNRGKLLSSFSSDALVANRAWLVKKQRTPQEFADLIQQIDDELSSRGGE